MLAITENEKVVGSGAYREIKDVHDNTPHNTDDEVSPRPRRQLQASAAGQICKEPKQGSLCLP